MSVVRRLFALLFFLLAASFSGAAELWETLPETGDPVKDFAALLPAETAGKLTATLRDFHTKTGASLVVVTVPSIDGAEIADFSNRLFNRWHVGDKATNRGVLLVVVKNDRKMRIECGYGAESVVPDAIAKRIILDDLTPAFKAGRYDIGILAGCRSIMARFGYDAPGAPPELNDETGEASGFGPLFFVILFFFIIMMSIFGRGRGGPWIGGSTGGGGWGGGSSGGGGGGYSGSSGGSSGGGGSSGSW